MTRAGLPGLRDTLMRCDLGEGDSACFLPGHALHRDLVTPATTPATRPFLLARGVVLASVFGRRHRGERPEPGREGALPCMYSPQRSTRQTRPDDIR